MENLTVYRYENEFGEGPFSGDFCGPAALFKAHRTPHTMIETQYHSLFQELMKLDFIFAWNKLEHALNFPKGNTPEEIEENISILKCEYDITLQKYETHGCHLLLPDGQVIFKRGHIQQSDYEFVNEVCSVIEFKEYSLNCDPFVY